MRKTFRISRSKLRGLPTVVSGVVVLCSIAAHAQESAERYLWPLEQPRVLTSSFCEYRSSGFHMGIDLRTGPPGKNVRAASDGYVERVRCSPWGYGKAVYLRMDDGHTIVYAHLSDYAPEIREYVQRAQHARQSYEVDLYPERDFLRVARGDVIAKSGQTGIGAPHLHMELRSPAGVPIDPLTAGFVWNDDVAPTIRSVAIEPARPDVLINGQHRRLVFDRPGNALSLIAVTGPYRASVYAIDTAGAASTRLGVFRAELRSGELPIHSLQFDAMSYADRQYGAVTFHPYLRDLGRYLTLRPWPGSGQQPFRKNSDRSDEMIPGESTIVVTDMHGNASTISLAIDNNTDGSGGILPETESGTVNFFPMSDWLVVEIVLSADSDTVPRVDVIGATRDRADLRTITERRYQAAIVPPERAKVFDVLVSHPAIENVVKTFHVVRAADADRVIRDGDVTLRMGGKHVFGTTLIAAQQSKREYSTPARAVSQAYNIWHPDHPLRSDVTLRVPLRDAVANLTAVHGYRRLGDGRWRRLETRRFSEAVEFETRTFGTFVLMEDTKPPTLRIRTAGGSVSSRRPTLRASAVDSPSGVETYGATANGEWLLVAYDPERDELRWEEDRDLPTGAVTVTFHATDHAGNTARASVELLVP